MSICVIYGGTPTLTHAYECMTYRSYGMRVESSTKNEEGFEYSCTDLVQVWRSSLFILLEVDFALFHKYEVCLVAIWKAWKHPERKLNPEERNVSDSSQPVFGDLVSRVFRLSWLFSVIIWWESLCLIFKGVAPCPAIELSRQPKESWSHYSVKTVFFGLAWGRSRRVHVDATLCEKKHFIVLDQQRIWSLETQTFSNMQCKQTTYCSSLLWPLLSWRQHAIFLNVLTN